MKLDNCVLDTQDEATHNPLDFDPSDPPMRSEPQQAATRSFEQAWGLHAGMALLVLVLNAMLFGAEVGTGGLAYPIVLAAAVALGFITYFAQMRSVHDDSNNAALKAAIVTLLTAIPVPLPALLSVPAGLVGLVHTLRRKP